MNKLVWTQGMDEQLVSLFIQSETIANIADSLGVNKKQVSGRLHRLRTKPPEYIDQDQQLLIAANNQTKQMKRDKNKRFETFKKPEKIVDPNIKKLAISLTEIKTNQCSWPMDDGSCCGNSVVSIGAMEGDRRRTHCQHHYNISTGVING